MKNGEYFWDLDREKNREYDKFEKKLVSLGEMFKKLLDGIFKDFKVEIEIEIFIRVFKLLIIKILKW